MTPAQRLTLQIYGPDLYRSDHTPDELRQLCLTDPVLVRWERVRLLALTLETRAEGAALRARLEPEARRRGVLLESYVRTADRLCQRYRGGGLAGMMAESIRRIPRRALARYRAASTI